MHSYALQQSLFQNCSLDDRRIIIMIIIICKSIEQHSLVTIETVGTF